MQGHGHPLTVLGRGARIQGDFFLSEDAIVAGRVDGHLQTDGRIELTVSAHIGGKLTAGEAVLAGRVIGDVEVAGLVHLKAGVQIEGSLSAGRLQVDDDVTFTGSIRLGSISRAQPQAPAPQPEAVQDDQAFDEHELLRQFEEGFAEVPGAVNAGLRSRRRLNPAG